MISKRELRRNNLHIQQPFIPKSIRRLEDYTVSNFSTLPQAVSTERVLEEKTRNKTKKLISDASLSYAQSKLLHNKIQQILQNFNSNKLNSMHRTYNPLSPTRRRLQISKAISRYPQFSRPQIGNIQRLFTPESNQRGGFSPQPWRVFSPMDRKIIKRQRKDKSVGQFDDNAGCIKNCRNLIYDEKTNEDLIYFPFSLRNFREEETEAKQTTIRLEENDSESEESESESEKPIKQKAKVKAQDIFSSQKKIRSKESRVSLRYGLESEASEIQKAVQQQNDKFKDRDEKLKNKKISENLNKTTDKVLPENKIKFKNSNNLENISNTIKRLDNRVYCMIINTKKRMTLVENSGFINELRQPKTAILPAEDDFKVVKDEEEIQKRKQRNSRLTTILTDKELENIRDKIASALKK